MEKFLVREIWKAEEKANKWKNKKIFCAVERTNKNWGEEEIESGIGKMYREQSNLVQDMIKEAKQKVWDSLERKS